jgi:hypothetical protein
MCHHNDDVVVVNLKLWLAVTSYQIGNALLITTSHEGFHQTNKNGSLQSRARYVCLLFKMSSLHWPTKYDLVRDFMFSSVGLTVFCVVQITFNFYPYLRNIC